MIYFRKSSSFSFLAILLSLTLVDNASPDGAGEWLAAQQLGPGVKVVRLPENVAKDGYSMHILSSLSGKRRAYQSVKIYGSSDSTYLL